MHCDHHPTCPGCPLLDRSPDEQLTIKRRRLDHALKRYPQLPVAPPVTAALHTEAYRHRLKLPVFARGEQVSIGLYERGSRRVLHTPDCPVLADGLRAALPRIVDWLRNRRGIHSLDLRVSSSTGDLQLVLAVEGGDLHGGRRAIRALQRAIPELKSVAISIADPERRRVMGRTPKMVAGPPVISERIGQTDYVLHPGAFFQVDPRNAVQIHDLVRDWVGDARSVLDLYAGVGAYARMLAPTVDDVVAVEEVPAAARAAADGAPPNLDVLTARVEDVDVDEHFDAVILNPARRGADPRVLERVAQLADKRIVMVSCGPESLARDLDVLSAHGFHVADMAAVDLFPQTAEVETVVRLERGQPRRTWKVKGGRAGTPWAGKPSGAVGRPDELVVLAVGEIRGLTLPGARWTRIARVATHTLLHLHLNAPMGAVLAALSRAGHPVAGADPRTRRFFTDKALLARPFVHVLRAGRARAPLHGDLLTALDRLGAPASVLDRLSR
jgi:23S rRNA (uracil1939-C5)-methyltransferase